MAVDKIDPQLQSIISDAQLRSQKTANKDDQVDAARKAAEKRQAEKKREIEAERNKESFVRSPQQSPKASKLIQPQRSAQATSALNAWKAVTDGAAFSLSPSQSKVIESHVVEDPQRSQDAAAAFSELSAKPAFKQAVSSRDQMFNLQRALLEKPQVAPAAEKVLDSKFMQSSNADNRTKTSFLKMSLNQASKGGTDLSVGGLKHAAQMMGTLVDSGVGAMGQRSALSMVERRPTDTKAMDSVSKFSSSPVVQSQTPAVKTKAASLLAKANGSESVAKGFQELVSAPAFKEQTTSNQARMFSTIGSAKVQDYRAMTDVTLNAIRSPELGNHSGDVSTWLKSAASKVASEGIGAAKALPNRPMSAAGMPQPPKLVDMSGLDGDELQQARAQNRAKVIQYYTGVQRHLDKQEKGIEGAKFAEDIHGFTQNLKTPVNLDLSALTPEEHAFAMERRESVLKKFDEVKKLHRQRSRELRGKRRPAAERIAPEQKATTSPRYFTIEGGRHNVASLLTKDGAPATLGLETPDWLGDVVRQALGSQSGGSLNQAGIEEVAKAVATKVASEVVESLTQSLGTSATTKTPIDRDSMGVPRSRGAELGPPQIAVRPKQSSALSPAKPALEVRDSATIFDSNWKALSRAESAMLRNLGWDQSSWDNKLSAQAKWPRPMFTPFASLTPIQREAVERLGFTVEAWNKRVEAFTSGRNA